MCAALGFILLCTAQPSLAQLRTELFVSGLSQPVAFVQDPSQPNVQVVVLQGGRVRVIQNGLLLAQDYLDLTSQVASGGEGGLLGLAFAPDYAASGRVYVNFTNLSGDTVIARFLRHPTETLRADPDTRFDLVWPGGVPSIHQPFGNHNGGHLAFGPDGYLYIGLGDGGSGDDPFHYAQNPGSLLGKMLRLDVSVSASHPTGYVVPPTNPFVGQAGVLGEIWDFGLRNPWRYSFDDPARGGTGALLVADVGQAAWEEVNHAPAGEGGRNYGWRNREGAHDNVLSLPPYFLPLTDPIYEYSHTDGGAITGGFVYRGDSLGASYKGRYFFADIISNRVWSLALSIDGDTGEATSAGVLEHTAELGTGATAVSSFGVDADGELYLVSYAGSIYRIAPAVAPSPGASCAGADPFAAIGGGACCDGGWLPPGMVCSSAPATPPPPPPPPPSGGSCTAPDPFGVLGGGTCCNGGWLPPGMVCSVAPVTPPPPSSPPPAGGACATADPFAVLGGGTCCNGGWLPPGMTCSLGPVTPPPPPPPPTGICTTADPFVALGGGTCCNGGWLPPGMACRTPVPQADMVTCFVLTPAALRDALVPASARPATVSPPAIGRRGD